MIQSGEQDPSIRLIEETLLPEVRLESVDPFNPIVVHHTPAGWKLLGTGNYASVFEHPSLPGKVVKVYAPGRPGWQEECDVYEKLGTHPAYSTLHAAGVLDDRYYLVLKKLEGKTFYNCLRDGTYIPEKAVRDVDKALDYARSRGLNPKDVHGKNVMLKDGRGLVVDISDFLQAGPCVMWKDLRKAYFKLYKPLMPKRPFPMPDWTMDSIRYLYRRLRKKARLDGRHPQGRRFKAKPGKPG
ncbi:serine/threonine-protein kinase [Saccharibacillus alkalitolerans]|uniref:Serine/threonine protein kinase n=1 Tax=Saccharibacillus alkalitolerans TaxID=2705290 RepID=A0ABX0F8X4_9BACL|nr:serine/threonine protein kinase [Saccharibacillus alkalitolerans]NGZ77327.1 serine/threonine protein kinase [Saccharibacillus alkalitolerans]